MSTLMGRSAGRILKISCAMLLLSATVTSVHASPSSMTETLQTKAAEIAPDLVKIRRQIHMYPELFGEEKKTASLVSARLEKLGLEVTSGVGGYGVIGILHGGKPGPVVAYRADMDAVPSAVIGDVPYKSRVEGVKHVCGHDAHVAIGLGVAEILASVRSDLPGTVKFLFQPSEENARGAAAMVADGALENPKPQAIFAIHTFPIPVGTMGCPLGVGLSGYEPFQIRLRGSGDVKDAEEQHLHSIQALNTVAPITGPETYVHILQEIFTENSSFEEYVFIMGLNSSEADDGLRLIQGGVRAARGADYDDARAAIRAAAQKVSGNGVQSQCEFSGMALPNMNSDVELVRGALPAIEAVLGPESTKLIYASIPYFGEDFAFYQQSVPGAMFFLGVANQEKGLRAYNHFPDYDLDESAIGLGAATMSNVLWRYLNQ